MRIIDDFKSPGGAKFDGGKAHRGIIAADGRGLVSTMGPNCIFYANNVGNFSAASEGRNWDRLASAAHRWAMKLVDNSDFRMLLFPRATLVLAEERDSRGIIFSGYFLSNEPGVPLEREKVTGKERPGLVRVLN